MLEFGKIYKTANRSKFKMIGRASRNCRGQQIPRSLLENQGTFKTSFLGFWFSCFVFEAGSCYITQAVVELTILLPLLSEFRDYRCVPPCQVLRAGISNEMVSPPLKHGVEHLV
jgi:hypothetical protein